MVYIIMNTRLRYLQLIHLDVMIFGSSTGFEEKKARAMVVAPVMAAKSSEYTSPLAVRVHCMSVALSGVMGPYCDVKLGMFGSPHTAQYGAIMSICEIDGSSNVKAPCHRPCSHVVKMSVLPQVPHSVTWGGLSEI